MLEEEFNKKYPDVKWEFPLDEDECYRGYPTIRILVMPYSTVMFDIESVSVESCLTIADKILTKLEDIDFSDNENYLKRAADYHEQYFQWKKENEKKKVS